MARTRLSLIAALMAVAATAVALSAAERAPAAPQAGIVGSGTPATAPATPPAAAQVDWLARYGTYNVRQGTWVLIPGPNGC